MRCESKQEFTRLLKSVASATGRENEAFLNGVGAEPTVVSEDPDSLIDEDEVARTIAKLCMDEQREVTHWIAHAAADHAALEKATGKRIDAPVATWPSRLTKAQIAKRSTGKA